MEAGPLEFTRVPRTRGLAHGLAHGAALLAGLLLLGLAPLLSGEAPALASSPLRLVANLLPWLGPWLLLLAWTRRPLAAAAWVGLLQSLWFGIHRIKLQQLGLALLPADAAMIVQVVGTPALYLRYVEPVWLLAGAAAVAAIALLQRAEAANPWLRRHGRAMVLVASLLLIASLAAAAAPWRWLYDRDRLEVNIWLPAKAARDCGAVAHFLHLYLHTDSALPAADTNTVAAAHRWHQTLQGRFAVIATPAPHPDLIVVQSESFMDPGLLSGVDTATFAPHLAALRLRHAHGELRVPAFGGLTTRTEFEVLTAFPLAQTPLVQYPYQWLVHRPLPALPWVLRNAGYRTAAVHPYDRQFYRRDRVYPLLGFESFHSIDEFDRADVHGYHIADSALNRRIRDLLDDGTPQFVFAITVENHGPWDRGRDLPEALLPVLNNTPPLTDSAVLALRQFLHHTRRADAALGELAQWVMRRERPTLLLFYGDHLPGLNDVFAAWPFDNGRPAFEQSTPWLLVDNRGGHARRIDLEAGDLPGWLLAQAGIVDESLFAELEAIRRARAASALPESARDWRRHLVAARLQQTPHAATTTAWSEAQLATVEVWSPKSAEAGTDDATPLAFWFRFSGKPDPGFHLELGGARLNVIERKDGLVIAQLPGHARRRLLERAGSVPVALVDPLGRRRQTIAQFEVRARAERIGGWLGWGAGPFCTVEAFGPEHLDREAAAAHRQGLWIRASCIPTGATLVLDGTALETTIVDNVATAWVPPALVAAAHDADLRLRAGDAELAVGRIQIHP